MFDLDFAKPPRAKTSERTVHAILPFLSLVFRHVSLTLDDCSLAVRRSGCQARATYLLQRLDLKTPRIVILLTLSVAACRSVAVTFVTQAQACRSAT